MARISGGVQSNDSHVEGFLEGDVYLRWVHASDFSADWAKCRPFEPELSEHKASNRGVLGRASRPHGKRLVARSKHVVTRHVIWAEFTSCKLSAIGWCPNRVERLYQLESQPPFNINED